MFVIADTGPLNYLILIGQAQLLPQLYKRVLLPQEVLLELRAKGSPPLVGAWALQPPPWIEVMPPRDHMDQTFRDLDAGERAVLRLAQEVGPPVLLLIDDMAARIEAERLQIGVIGTLGILREGAAAGRIDLEQCFVDLRRTNFHAPLSLMNRLLAEQDSI